MKKRGVLFYVIDAFIAAGIVAITIAIVFSFISSSQEPESVKSILDSYVRFFERTQFIAAPGSTAASLLDNISDPRQPLVQGVAELIIADLDVEAESLVQEITSIILPAQFGMYFHFNGTSIYNRSTEKMVSSKLLLTKQISVVVATRAKVETEVFDFAGLHNSGNDACAALGRECRFVFATCAPYESYEECGTDTSNYDLPACASKQIFNASCATFFDALLEGPYVVEIGVWS